MFKIDLSDTVVFPVKFSRMNSAGKSISYSIKFEFIRIDRDEWDDFIVKNESDSQPEEKTHAELLEADTDFVLRIAKNWGQNKIGDSEEFNRENVRTLLKKCPGLAVETVKAFWAVQHGAALQGN